ncbi:3-hydroxybutyryl-CoA dehydrogenase [Amycolatopsis jejuensis]|uniref:3-hydroxybutyryl-CoA dehydrogenase n=1 Tax=Amycolatopsis jejuensis TaxID=330084 RepID=UPI0006918493|nr:3-hydroxybutyryl-CoA dehydrogenase [Amycolatopsis jejuensis]
MDDVRRVGVVGCGLMGVGLAELCAGRQLDVVVVGRQELSIEGARARLAKSLYRSVAKGRLTEAQRVEALSRVRLTTDFGALADRQFVIECVREDEDLKREIFEELDKTAGDAVLATGTSSIPVMRLANATARPGRVIGAHFFNPVPVMPLVEVIATLCTDDETVLQTELFLTGVLGKEVVRAPDRSGFLVNALLIPYLLSAVRMVDGGAGSAADVDRAVVLGCGYPMGPLAVIDLIGLDVVAKVAAALYDEFKEPQYVPPPMLLRLVDAGRLGKKTGSGFHHYPS